MRKDSLEITADDRAEIRAQCKAAAEDRIVITHGTDTMTVTAEALIGIPGKTIVLTGSLAPARFRATDAVFNLGCALGAAAAGPRASILLCRGRYSRLERCVRTERHSASRRSERFEQ